MSNQKDSSEQFCNDFWQEAKEITEEIGDKGKYWIECRENAKSEYLKKEYNELVWQTHDLMIFLNDLTQSYGKLYDFENIEFEKSMKVFSEGLRNLYDIVSSGDIISEDTKKLVENSIELNKFGRNQINSNYDLEAKIVHLFFVLVFADNVFQGN